MMIHVRTQTMIAVAMAVAMATPALLPSCKQRVASSNLQYAGSEESKILAIQSKAIFEKSCGACHGKGGSGEAGFEEVDNLNALVTRGYVVPGNPSASRLLQRIKNGSMPPAGSEPRPTAAEIATIQKWIELGAPDDSADRRVRKILTNSQIYDLMAQDIQQVPPADREFTRYALFHPIYNATGSDGRSLFSDEEIAIYRKGFVKLVNSLSFNRDIVIPVDVAGTDGAVMRLNLRDYAISPVLWESVVSGDPYRVAFPFESRGALVQQTNTRAPEFRADWFVFVASVPPFYHQFLNIPSLFADLERQLQLNINDNITRNRVHRIGFNKSGVSNFNRMIEHHDLPDGNGSFWISYDFGGTGGAGKNLFAQPLGPFGPFDAEQSFIHDGGEMIWNLPNGLQAYMLTTEDGRRLDIGPINIVSDPKRPDRQVVNGLSCMQCHAEGIKDKADEIRDVVLASREAYGQDAARILELYREKDENDRVIQAGQKRFAAALAKMGITPDEAEPTLAIQKHFENEVSGPLAAAEFGIDYATMVQKLRALPDSEFRLVKRDLAALSVRGGTVKRDTLALHFAKVADAIGLREAREVPVVPGAPSVVCHADAVEKSSGKIVRTVRGNPQSSEPDARQSALAACRLLVEGLSLYECRDSRRQSCERN